MTMHASIKTVSPYTIGVPVRPADFHGYEDQVVQFFRQCIFGPVLQPVRILGLRRSGKTSFLKYIASRYVPRDIFTDVRREQLLLIYLDLEFISSPSDFFLTVHDAVEKHSTAPARSTDEPTTARSFTKWLESFIAREKEKKLIILLDEFEKIHASASFDSDFFGFLRFLAGSYNEQLTWVTASAIDLHTLDKNEKTSPFWNIFRNTPIMMGGLDTMAAEKVIREPAKKFNIEYTRSEISEILFLAGRLPYFIQAVADEWFQCRSEDRSVEEIKDRIVVALTSPANQVQRVLEGYWESMSAEKRHFLTDIAAGVRPVFRNSNIYNELMAYGLLQDGTVGVKISGELLKQFVINKSLLSHQASIAAGPPGENKTRVEPEDGPSTPTINVFIDSRIGQMRQNANDHSVINTDGTYVAGNVNVAGGDFVGRDHVEHTGLDVEQAKSLLDALFAKIENHPELNANGKSYLKEEISEVRNELDKQDKMDEKSFTAHLRNIGKMAPDILEVILETILNPVAGFSLVARKIAHKIKSVA